MGRFITNQDVEAYGPELVDMSFRAAREALQPELDEVRRKQADLAQREQRLQNQSIFNQLDQALPNWRQINNSPAFLEWLAAQHVYAGQSKHSLLLAAFESGDAARVLVFFRDFLAQSSGTAGHAQASGRAQTRQAVGQVTAKDIEKFYSDCRRGRYNGREAERDAEERRLHAALHGRR